MTDTVVHEYHVSEGDTTAATIVILLVVAALIGAFFLYLYRVPPFSRGASPDDETTKVQIDIDATAPVEQAPMKFAE